MSNFKLETSCYYLAYLCEQQYLCNDDNENKACVCIHWSFIWYVLKGKYKREMPQLLTADQPMAH